MHLDDFNFVLPSELIAYYPLEKRSASRLLCVDQKKNNFIHRTFDQLIDLISPGDLLIFNNSKVIPARLIAKKITGGRVEVLVERILNPQSMSAQIRTSKSLNGGDKIYFPDQTELEITGKENDFYILKCSNEQSILETIERIGQVPLPPYINRAVEENDKERYQTVYAKYKGSVAAPTAGFHFDHELLQKLREKKVNMGFLTLHIGAGTFKPVRVNTIESHKMHSEYFQISPELCAQIALTKAQGKRIIAVGTTSLRALETASRHGNIAPFEGDTNIFIYPGFKFQCVNALITNLHLPCSTLLMLVCAFGGYQKIMRAYEEAIRERYRFYSFGDAMWITG